MMEKYDGVRVFWDGKHLLLKNSKTVINVPQDCAFPSVPFEGELWFVTEGLYYLLCCRMGYNNRQQCVEFLTTMVTRNWKSVKIMVFDAPQATDKSYAQRLELLRQSK
jgi:DNA ligase-1